MVKITDQFEIVNFRLRSLYCLGLVVAARCQMLANCLRLEDSCILGLVVKVSNKTVHSVLV